MAFTARALALIDELAAEAPDALSAEGAKAATERTAAKREQEERIQRGIQAVTDQQMANMAKREAIRNGTYIEPPKPRPGLDPRRFDSLEG